MTSVAVSAEHFLRIRKQAAYPAVLPAGKRTTFSPWQAIVGTASSIAFFGVLGWEVWRIGGLLLQYATQVAAAGFGGLL